MRIEILFTYFGVYYRYKYYWEKYEMNNLEIALNGVKIASDILNIPAPEVYFLSADNFTNKDVNAMFRFSSYEILFNVDWVLNVPWIEVIVTCFHEARHAYQSHSIIKGINEPIEVLEQWELEFESYNTPSGSYTPLTDFDYLNQSIEIDAIRFTHNQIVELFGVKTIRNK